MLDNQLIALIISTILAQELVAGIPGTPVAQAFQPTQQGVSSEPTAYLYKLFDHRLGSPYRADVYDAVAQKMIHTEVQDYETSFQISALAAQTPTSTTQYTASDIVNLIAYILQSSMTIEAFQAKGVAILRVTDIRNPYFTDDRDQNEASPSFDFTVQHKQTISSIGATISSETFNLIPV